MKILESGCVTGNLWSDFGSDLGHEADTGISKRNFTTAGHGLL